MNIWYFHHYAGGPGMGRLTRPYHLSRAWAHTGHTTTNFVASFHHMLDIKEPLPPELTVDGVRYVALPARPYSGNGLGRIKNMGDYCRAVLHLPARVPSDLAKPDAIIVSSPQPFAIFPAAKLARQFGAHLTFEVRDLWPLSLIEINGTSKFHPFAILTAFTEWFAYRKANLVSSVLGGAEAHMRAHGLGPNKFVHVPNAVSLARLTMPEVPTTAAGLTAAAQIAAWKAEGRLVAIHPGAQGAPNGLDKLLEAMSLDECAGDRRPVRRFAGWYWRYGRTTQG
ncbi:glycosyltransferase [Devosia algicola]|uniref:Glycosyltransferase n=1 Tax=Devosia algicola TaxID=3026418 RepID=A0ABY7YJJ2_9HYPH|nr:glycosyltransferase [Devosia algicola]WDR01369.1 glycosyltransferase [Devosia algicola]